MTHQTLVEPRNAYETGKIKEPLMLDNDDTHVYVETARSPGWQKVFGMHPEELLEQALDLLGIPHEQV